MGYGTYTLPDGREAGYAVIATCDAKKCDTEINRGLGHLCGNNPDGHRNPEEPGCGKYFCGEHTYNHQCPAPECGLFNPTEEYSCGLKAGHEGDHYSPDEDAHFSLRLQN